VKPPTVITLEEDEAQALSNILFGVFWSPVKDSVMFA